MLTPEKVETELNIPKEVLIREGIKHYLKSELRNVRAEIMKIQAKHGVTSFEELLKKLERGEVAESECFDDLTRLEHLELRRDKIQSLLGS